MNSLPINSYGTVTVVEPAANMVRTFDSVAELAGYYASFLGTERILALLSERADQFAREPAMVENLRLLAQRIVSECVAAKLIEKGSKWKDVPFYGPHAR